MSKSWRAVAGNVGDWWIGGNMGSQRSTGRNRLHRFGLDSRAAVRFQNVSSIAGENVASSSIIRLHFAASTGSDLHRRVTYAVSVIMNAKVSALSSSTAVIA